MTTRAAYEVVVGLEVHLALRTRTKLFCGCPVPGDDDDPNAHVCPVCLGLPGALPVANARALELAVRFAQALGCDVPAVTAFARKHYGYPDAPKNYQLSQSDRPVGLHGALVLPGGGRVRIARVHLEEDAGRLVHPTYADHSLADFGRAGTPLVEMVTEPDLRSGEEARAFLEEVRALARALDVSDATPEEGKMRADVNVSLRRPGAPLGTKVEVKNLNSFKSVQAAIESEAQRQARRLDAGLPVVQETRGWVEGGQKSVPLRTKEQAADYRYLDDPDLPPVALRADWLAAVRAATPETPAALRHRYRALGVRDADADRLAADVDAARAFDALVAAADAAAAGSTGAPATAAPAPAPRPQALANWLLVEVAGAGVPFAAVPAAPLAALVALAEAGDVTGPTAKGLLAEVLAGADPTALVDARGLRAVRDAGALEAWVDAVLAAYADVVATVHEQPKALNFLMGRVMKASAGQATPDAVRALLRARLGLDD